MFPNLASRFAPESYSPVANCQVSPEQLEEPAKKRTRQHTNGVSARKDGRFSQGVIMKKKQPKVHVHHYFWWGNHSKMDHRSDRFYAYSTSSKLEMTKTVMMGIKYLLILFRSEFFC